MRMHDAAELGMLVRDRRRQLGLSQAALAEQLHVSRQWVVSLERGKPTVELGLALRALHAVGLEVQVSTGGGADDLDLDDVFEKLWQG